MSNIEIPTHPLKWEVAADDLSAHKYPGDSVQRLLATDLDTSVSVPTRETITHGYNYPWKDYGREKSAYISKKGPYESVQTDGCLDSTNWGSQGKKHSETFSMGITDETGKQLWLPTGKSGQHTGITGFGFEARRVRTDSKSFGNENCKNWMPFIRRFGARFINRTNGDYRFSSSNELAEDGLPLSKFGSPTVSGKTWHLYEFYNLTSWGSSWENGQDWLLESLWWNITNRDIAGTGTATGYIYIYNLQFYSDFGTQSTSTPAGSQRIIRPAEQSLSNRNICALGG